MDRRKFFSILPALSVLPAICEKLAKVRFWEGTSVPRPQVGYRYSYYFVNKNGDIVATSPDLKAWTMHRS